MNLSEKIGKLFLIGIEGTELSNETKKVLRKIKPGFVIIFKENAQSALQLKKLILEIRAEVRDKVIFAVDQEGGIVTRLEGDFCVSPGAMGLSALKDREMIKMAASILGNEMRSCGISFNLAPVVDINNPKNPGVGIRSFGDKKEDVSYLSGLFFEGLRSAKVASCAKHFPGLGDVKVDPHKDMPVLNKNYKELEQYELTPFKYLIDKGIETIMPTHIHLPAVVEEKIPASLSEEFLSGILRKKMNFKGLIVADDLLMGGVKNYFSIEEASFRAVTAGMDVVSICHEREIQLRAFDFLNRKLESDRNFVEKVEKAYQRVKKFIELYFVEESEINIENIGLKENKRVIEIISEKTITVYKNEDHILPLKNLGKNDFILSVKPFRQSLVEDKAVATRNTRFAEGAFVAAKISRDNPEANLIIFSPDISPAQVQSIEAKGNICIFFSENATLFKGQEMLLKKSLANFKTVLLVCLRNPYDTGIEGVRNAVLTYGYTIPVQKALIKVLKGEITAEGVCPVKI